MKITKKDLTAYLNGSQFLATGGGLPFAIHEKIFQRVLLERQHVEAISLKDLNADDVVVSAYGIGDPSIIPENFADVAITAFDKYKKMTGYDIKGIIPGEIGAEGLAFLVSQYTHVPVIDADLVGGRAAPEIQLDVFTVCNLSITPILLMALNGKSIFLEGVFTAKEIEKISRDFFSYNGSSGLLVGYGTFARDLAEHVIQNTLTLSMQIGAVLRNKDMKKMLQLIEGEILCKTTVEKVLLESSRGFLCGTITCTNGVMSVKNENMYYADHDGGKWCAPDILMLLDEECNPIHNAHVADYINKEVYVIHAPAMGYWQEKKARKMWYMSFSCEL